MRHHVIFVPGLGDRYSYGQNIAIQMWRIWGFTPHYLALGWHLPEGRDVKLGRLNEKINQLTQAGSQVSLVGVSAGASAVLNAYAVSANVHRVVWICGKINRPETVDAARNSANPDYKPLLHHLQPYLKAFTAQDKQRFLSVRPITDHTVPVVDTRLEGVTEKITFGHNHVQGIAFGIIQGTPAIMRFLRDN